MGYIERFKEALFQHSVSKVYSQAIKEWVYEGETFDAR